MNRTPQGFALLAVLIVLALLGSTLTQSTRRALGRSMALERRAQVVRGVWAQRSVAAAVAPHTRLLLAPDRRRRSAPRAERRLTVTLGSTRVRVVVTDEQARLNLHTFETARATRDALHQLLGAEVASRYVQLRPLEGLAAAPSPVPAEATDSSPDADADAEGALGAIALGRGLDSGDDGDVADDFATDVQVAPLLFEAGRYVGYGQVFRRAGSSVLVGAVPGKGLASRVTLWGDGRLHFAASDTQTLRSVLAPRMTAEAVEILLAAHRRGVKLEKALQLLGGASGSSSEDLARRLTSDSRVHGVWTRAGLVGDVEPVLSSAFHLIEGFSTWRRVTQWE